MSELRTIYMKSAFYQHLGNSLCILIIAAFNFFFPRSCGNHMDFCKEYCWAEVIGVMAPVVQMHPAVNKPLLEWPAWSQAVGQPCCAPVLLVQHLFVCLERRELVLSFKCAVNRSDIQMRALFACGCSKCCCAGCNASAVCLAFLFWLSYFFALVLPRSRGSENCPRTACVLVCLK